jgi:hypothetical protein
LQKSSAKGRLLQQLQRPQQKQKQQGVRRSSAKGRLQLLLKQPGVQRSSAKERLQLLLKQPGVQRSSAKERLQRPQQQQQKQQDVQRSSACGRQQQPLKLPGLQKSRANTRLLLLLLRKLPLRSARPPWLLLLLKLPGWHSGLHPHPSSRPSSLSMLQRR